MRSLSLAWLFTLSMSVLLGMATPAHAAPQVITDTGNISDGVDAFRAALGNPLNGVLTGEQPAGRREINWDAVPGGVTNTDTFPAAFFNTNSPRGAVFSPSNGFRVSDNDFADINANYADEFNPFSAPKTFMVLGDSTMEVLFQVAGSTTPAAVRGFGVVFSDVDVAGTARLELFAGPVSLGAWEAPVRSDAGGLSFLGVIVPDGPAVTRVRITSGQAALAPGRDDVSDGGAADLVVMDDFLYSEPRADTDRDGVLDVSDTRAASDTRAKVDINGNNPGQLLLDNRTLATGETIQDLVEDCRRDSNNVGQFRSCILRLAKQLRSAGILDNNQRKELEKAAKRVTAYR